MEKISFGVSPAYFLSLYGNQFSAQDVCEELPHLRYLGFDCFQAEIFDEDKLESWLDGGAQAVRRAAAENRLWISASVAHFLLPAFSDWAHIASRDEFPSVERFLTLSSILRGDIVVSVPLGPYVGERPDTVLAASRQKLCALAELCRRRGLPLAIEVQPGAILQTPRELLPILEEAGCGFNLDTGHTFAAGCDVVAYPSLFQDRILTTHLCDNDGINNLSLLPGTGGIDFAAVVQGLAQSGYRNSYDLEIFTEPGRVDAEYQQGLASLKGWLGN